MKRNLFILMFLLPLVFPVFSGCNRNSGENVELNHSAIADERTVDGIYHDDDLSLNPDTMEAPGESLYDQAEDELCYTAETQPEVGYAALVEDMNRCNYIYFPGYSYNGEYAATIPLATAAYLFSRLCELFAADGGYLWGKPLHTPYIFLDVETRAIVANKQNKYGTFRQVGNVFVGYLPSHLPATYSFPTFYGLRWVVYPWHLVCYRTNYIEDILESMVHTSFHVHQPVLFGAQISWDVDHMNRTHARVLVQLELNALVHALAQEGDERITAVSDALSIRQERRRLFGRARDENSFEFHEGLANYTQARIVGISQESLVSRLSWWAYNIRHMDAMGGIFGYITGEIYGYLLDETGVYWRRYVNRQTDLGAMLKNALEIDELTPFNELDINIYGYVEISAFEADRLRQHEEMIEGIRTSFSEEPVLLIPRQFLSGEMTMNPTRMFSISGLGRAFGSYVAIFGTFGRLDVYDGFYIFPEIVRNGASGKVIATNITTDGNRVYGPGWVLELEDGYEVRPSGDDFVVARR